MSAAVQVQWPPVGSSRCPLTEAANRLRRTRRRVSEGDHPFGSCSVSGTGAGARTLTPLRAADFKSAASAIPPLRHE